MKKALSLLLCAMLPLSLAACAGSSTSAASQAASSQAAVSETETSATPSGELAFNNAAWNYDADNDVYWQIQVVYCATPAAEEYESLGIYVPGAYLDATDNGDGTYTCTLNETGTINGYTAATAPIVMPVNTAGYSAQSAPTSYSYSGLASYLEAGFVYVYAGCRGRSNGYDDAGNLTYSGGAPWGVTDLKAAVRYLRYNSTTLPGNTDSIFTFGHSGGGAQSALMGATGDSELYYDYLASIGAAMYDDNGNYISDAICGAMCWCPITSLDTANEAYEWMMGQYATSGTRADDTWTSAFSDDLAEAFAAYINAAGYTSADGTVLTLAATDEGIYTSGTYYEYLLSELERSLNNFLSDTSFPYTSGGSSEQADGGFAGGGASSEGMPSGSAPEGMDGEAPEDMGEAPSGMEGGMGGPGGESSTESVTYETAQDYIDSLNTDEEWVTYDAATNTASIISVEAFVTHCKNASKSVGAFDDLNRSQAENLVFGDDENDALHFDAIMAALLVQNEETYATYSDWDAAYVAAYQEYLTSVDAMGNSSETRQEMYNPMYYLSDYYDGYETSTVASHWRIHTGIDQGDTSCTVEMNLALALEQYSGVEDVAFEMVWGQGHTTAERTGNSTTNFIEWVNECLS